MHAHTKWISALVAVAVLLIVFASQLFWIGKIRDAGKHWVSSRAWRRAVAGAALAFYILVIAYNLVLSWRLPGSTRFTLRTALLDAPFKWWMFGSVAGFCVAACFGILDRAARFFLYLYRRAMPGAAVSPL